MAKWNLTLHAGGITFTGSGETEGDAKEQVLVKLEGAIDRTKTLLRDLDTEYVRLLRAS